MDIPRRDQSYEKVDEKSRESDTTWDGFPFSRKEKAVGAQSVTTCFAEESENESLPDFPPYWENAYEGVYSDDPEDGYPYDTGTKIQE